MKETSWRTLMLLTTLLAVVVIFQGTMRSPRLPAAQAQSPLAVRQVPDANKPPDKPARSRMQPVTSVAAAYPVQFDDMRKDASETGWSAPPAPQNLNATDQSVPPVPENQNEADESVPPVPDDPNESSPPMPE